MTSAGFSDDVIDGLQVLICGLDDEGHIHVFNRPCERLTGYMRQEVIGKSWLELFAIGDRAERVVSLWRTAHDETPSGPLESLCRKGRSIRWQFSRWNHSPPITLWAVGIDVTDEREALTRARQFERIVALGNLVSGLTHEMRNPLNGALLQLTLADRTLARLDPGTANPALTAVLQARSEMRRIAALLDDFLMFVRPQPLELQRTDLRQLVAHAVERSSPKAQAANIEVTIEPGPSAIALVDGSRVETAVYHLIANAIDAAAQVSQSKVAVRIVDRGNGIGIEVEDRGVGLPSSDIPIFEPFFSTKPGGTGLGLAIVQLVATDHGGMVTYERNRDATVFRLELPIVGGLPN